MASLEPLHLRSPHLARLRQAVYVLFLLAALAFVAAQRATLANLWRGQALTFLGASGLMLLGIFLQARSFISFIDVSHALRTSAFARVWAVSMLANYLSPLQPGVALRIAYLKTRGLTVTDGVLATGRMLAASVWTAALWLGAGLIAWNAATWPLVLGLWSAAIAAFAGRGPLLRALGRCARPQWLVRHREPLRRMLTGWSAQGLVAVTAQYALSTILLHWVYGRFGASLTLAQALIMTCAVYVSSLFSLLPGNFGVLEAIYLAAGHTAGLSTVEAAALAGLLRASHIAAIALLVLIGIPGRRRAQP
jgi:hypothetical protein